MRDKRPLVLIAIGILVALSGYLALPMTAQRPATLPTWRDGRHLAGTAGARRLLANGETTTRLYYQGYNGYEGATDTYLNDEAPEATHGTETKVHAKGFGPVKRILIRFDLSDIPAYAEIVDARLELYVSERYGNPTAVYAHRLLKAWDEAGANWNQTGLGQAWSEGGASAAGADYAVTSFSSPPITQNDVFVGINITQAVQEWVAEPLHNYGLVISSGSTADVRFWSSQASSDVRRPRLTVTYRLPEATDTPTPTLTPTGPPTLTPTLTSTPTRTPTPTFTAMPTKPGGWIQARAIPVCCSPGAGCTVIGDTTGKPNDAESYGAIPWSYPGPEDVYIFHKTSIGDVTVRIRALKGADLDLFMLSAPDTSALLNRDVDDDFTLHNVGPGTYYLIVDGYQGAAGPYELTFVCTGEPTPTPTPTNTPMHSYYPVLFKIPTPTPTISPTPTASSTPTATATPTETPSGVYYEFQVNCGATEWYQTKSGLWYSPDKPYEAGSWGWEGGGPNDVWPPYDSSVAEIRDTDDDPIYQRHRYGMHAYRFTVPAGHYAVQLHFAETFRFVDPGERVFRVDLEGQPILDRFDIRATVGAINWAYDHVAEIDVVDGVLDITFTPQSPEYGPVINGIHIWRLG